MWQETDQGLYQKFVFKNFAEAFAFMTRVSAIAERQQHHPRWLNDWNKVEVWLLSHDAGGAITDKDRQLANMIDGVVTQSENN